MTLRFPSTNTQFSNFTKPGIDRPITWRILRFSGTFAMLMRPWTFPRTQRFRQWLLEPLMSLSQRNGMWPLLIVVMLRQPSLLLLLGLLKKNFLLAEPWTVVLIQSFAKAGHILLNEADASPNTQNDPLGQSWLQCRYCLEALWCLGRKFKKKSSVSSQRPIQQRSQIQGKAQSIVYCRPGICRGWRQFFDYPWWVWYWNSYLVYDPYFT